MSFNTSYQKFAKFVKVTDATKYAEVKANENYAGSIIFYADTTHADFYQKIYANGIEYNIVDASYVQHLSDVLDASENVSLGLINSSALIDAATVQALVNAGVAAGAITAIGAGDIDVSIDAQTVYDPATDAAKAKSATVTLNVSYTQNGVDSSVDLPFTIASDTLDLQTDGQGALILDVSYTNSSLDIANASVDSSAAPFATNYAIKEYVDYALGQFNGALVYKGSISPSTNTSTANIAYLTGEGLSGADVSGDFAHYYATAANPMPSPEEHDDGYLIIPSDETPEIGYTFVANTAGYINFANKVVVSGERHTFEEIDPDNYDPTQYEGQGTFTDTNVVYLEPGDMVIVTDVSTAMAYDETAGENVEFKKITAITVVNRNITSNGLVSSSSTLTENHIVVGGGNFGVKTSDYVIYNPEDPSFFEDTDSSFYTDGSTLIVTAEQVKNYVEYQLQNIPQPVYETEFDTSVASVVNSVDSSHLIDIAAAVNSSYYLNVSVDDTNFDTSTITIGAKTLTLHQYAANVSNNTEPLDGLATTADVYEELTAIEKVVAGSIAQTAETVGLTSDFGVDWRIDVTDANSSLAFNASTNIVDAIKILKADVDSKGDLSADEFDTSVKVDGAANPSILDASFSAQANGNVLLNISLNTAETVATLNASSAYANTSATALMTDKDVNVAIENALCWAVIS